MTVPNSFGCVANTIRLRSGTYFDFIDPKPDQFTLEDIAGALSKICRFGGQIDAFYSVAEHSFHCAEQAAKDNLRPEIQQALLLHDAAEAFVGDMVKPLKVMLPEYDAIEERVERVIAEKFQVSFDEWKEAIREIDHAMLIAERRSLFSKDDVEWCGEKEVRKLLKVFPCWMPPRAEERFMFMAKSLGVPH